MQMKSMVVAGLSEEEARNRIYMVDSKGLITTTRGDKLNEWKQQFARVDGAPDMTKSVPQIRNEIVTVIGFWYDADIGSNPLYFDRGLSLRRRWQARSMQVTGAIPSTLCLLKKRILADGTGSVCAKAPPKQTALAHQS